MSEKTDGKINDGLQEITLPESWIRNIFIKVGLFLIFLYICFNSLISKFLNVHSQILNSSFGVAIGVVASISLASLTFIQLIFSFQTTERAGVKIEKVFKITRIHETFMGLVITTFILLGTILLSYLCENYLVCLLLLGVDILFSMFILSYACFYLFMNEDSMFVYIRYAMQKEFKENNNEFILWCGEIEEILIKLLENKDIKFIYEKLSEKNCDDYNVKLIKRLFDICINEMDKYATIFEETKNLKLVNNAKNTFTKYFDDFAPHLKQEENSKYYVSFALSLFKIKQTKHDVLNVVKKQLSYFLQTKEDYNYVITDAYVSNIIIITANSIKDNDFDLIHIIFEETYRCLDGKNGENFIYRIFMILSFILFYFSRIKFAISYELSYKINSFINNPIIFYGEVIPVRYKDIFAKVISKYTYGLNRFIKDFNNVKNKCEIGETIELRGAIVNINEFVFNWYIMCMLNSDETKNKTKYNVRLCVNGVDDWKYKALENIIKFCYQDSSSFKPDIVLNDMSTFYLNGTLTFKKFKDSENVDHTFLNYFNSLKKPNRS